MFNIMGLFAAASILILLFCGWLTSLLPLYWLACGLGLMWIAVMWYNLWRH